MLHAVAVPSPWPVLIAVHAVAATYALGLGGVQLIRRKGDRPHRWLGRSWVGAMAVVIATSFGIRGLTGGLSWLHGLSAFTALTLTLGVLAARRGDVRAHRGFLTGSYFGLVGALVGVVAVPSRRIPELAASDPVTLVLWTLAIGGSVVAVVAGAVVLSRPRRRPEPFPSA